MDFEKIKEAIENLNNRTIKLNGVHSRLFKEQDYSSEIKCKKTLEISNEYLEIEEVDFYVESKFDFNSGTISIKED